MHSEPTRLFSVRFHFDCSLCQSPRLFNWDFLKVIAWVYIYIHYIYVIIYIVYILTLSTFYIKFQIYITNPRRHFFETVMFQNLRIFNGNTCIIYIYCIYYIYILYIIYMYINKFFINNYQYLFSKFPLEILKRANWSF